MRNPRSNDDPVQGLRAARLLVNDEARRARVEALREAIAEGQYQVDLDTLADQLVGEEADRS